MVRRCSAVNEIPPGTGRLSLSSLEDPSVCSRMLPPSVQPTRRRRDQQWFDDAVEFAREHVIRLADLLERKAMSDEVTRVDVPRLDVMETARQVALHARLVGADGEALVHRIAELDRIEHRAERTDDGNHAALAHRI